MIPGGRTRRRPDNWCGNGQCNRMARVTRPLLTRSLLEDADGNPLGSGVYYLAADSPQVSFQDYETKPRTLLVVSHYNVVAQTQARTMPSSG